AAARLGGPRRRAGTVRHADLPGAGLGAERDLRTGRVRRHHPQPARRHREPDRAPSQAGAARRRLRRKGASQPGLAGRAGTARDHRGGGPEPDAARAAARGRALGAAPAPPQPLPAVPTLILAGEQDLRTPAAGAKQVQASIPGAQLLVVPYTGHSVLGSDFSGCAETAVNAFFSGRAVQPCASAQNLFAPTPISPTRLASLR